MLSLITRLFASRPTTTRRSNRTILGVDSLDVRVLPSAAPMSYDVVELSPAEERELHTRKTIQRVTKKNTLTLKYLSPGNYSVSYGGHHVGLKVMVKTHSSPPAMFTVQ